MHRAKDRVRIRKQIRRRKLHYLRGRLAQAGNAAERKKWLAKMKRVSPTAPAPEE
jgi:hypothetical protein